MSRKRQKMLNAAINTSYSSLSSQNWDKSRSTRLKMRDVQHVRITHSSSLLRTYNYGTKIGQGAFATVMAITDKQTNKDWAMKIINKTSAGDKLQALQREIQILKMVDHPHIIYLDKVYESPKNLYLILERCYGELSRIFMQKKKFSEIDTRKIIADLVSAVTYLHKNDIVHRDLKLQNILITQNPNDKKDKLYIKLSDFGLSIVKHGSSYEHMLHDYCGTLTYMAPEIITSHSYSQQCDIWAVGVIMYLLLSGEYPFYADQDEGLLSLICKQKPTYNNVVASTAAIHLLKKMLEKNPAMRITAAEIEMHPWIIGNPMPQRQSSPENVLDMMRLWRSDMKLPVGEECDWVTSAKAAESYSEFSPTTTVDRIPDSAIQHVRQSIVLPVQNIRFEKKRVTNSIGSKQSINTEYAARKRGSSTTYKPEEKYNLENPTSLGYTSARQNSTAHSQTMDKGRGKAREK